MKTKIQPTTNVVASFSGRVFFTEAMKTVRRPTGDQIVINDKGRLLVIDAEGNVETHEVPYGAVISVHDGGRVKKDAPLAEWDATSIPIIAEKEAQVVLSDMIEGQSIARQVDETTGSTTLVVLAKKVVKLPKTTDSKVAKLIRETRPRIILEGEERWLQCTAVLPPSTVVYVCHHDLVHPGQIIARIFVGDEVL